MCWIKVKWTYCSINVSVFTNLFCGKRLIATWIAYPYRTGETSKKSTQNCIVYGQKDGDWKVSLQQWLQTDEWVEVWLTNEWQPDQSINQSIMMLAQIRFLDENGQELSVTDQSGICFGVRFGSIILFD